MMTIFPQRLNNASSMFISMQNFKNFIQFHPVNFYISLEKRKKSQCLCNDMTDLRKIWRADAEYVSRARPIKNCISKIQDNGQLIRSRPVQYHQEILQFVDFQDGGCESSWNSEKEIFNSQLLQRHVLCYHDQFCGDQLNCCKDIAFFAFFK